MNFNEYLTKRMNEGLRGSMAPPPEQPSPLRGRLMKSAAPINDEPSIGQRYKSDSGKEYVVQDIINGVHGKKILLRFDLGTSNLNMDQFLDYVKSGRLIRID